MTLEAIQYKNGQLDILDQLKLPHESVLLHINSVSDGYNAIKTMQVRGAPAIAIVGCLSLCVELHRRDFTNTEELLNFSKDSLDHLVSARPTAVNIVNARRDLVSFVEDQNTAVEKTKKLLIDRIEKMLPEDIAINKAIGSYGAEALLKATGKDSVSVLTHCNTGSLATAGYGTALGVIRRLFEMGKLKHAFCTETRPYNQGCRLTAYELVHDGIPSTLICDSMAGWLMANGKVDAIVTGADQVAMNGDSANKIGTYSLAILANYHKLPFFIASPVPTVNPHRTTGADITIEERPNQEVTHMAGKRIAAPGINVWNPAFDVVPASLITGIVTDQGCFLPGDLKSALKLESKANNEIYKDGPAHVINNSNEDGPLAKKKKKNS